MKPSVPETGMVVSIEDGMAHIVLQSGDSCRGCGAAKMGLCKPAGNQSVLTAKNTADAVAGDIVKIELDAGIQTKGYLLAFIIPLFSLIAGAVAGNILSGYLSFPALDIVAGFAALIIASLYSLMRLKRLNASSMMVIKKIISAGTKP